jgi:DNA polymerase-1
MTAKTWYLIDGSGYIFRAYHALPPMNRPDGTPVNAVFGFCNMMLKLFTDHHADGHLVVVFDAARKTFRNDIYPAYKAHRPAPPEDLIPQFALIRDAVRAFNIPCIEQDGFEADDLIATYAAEAVLRGDRAVIVSADKDLMQLVRDGVYLFDPMKNRALDRDAVIEKFGVPPEWVVDVQALAGDSTDNVPGVPGIGLKTAAQLILEYGDLDTLLNRAGEIKQPKRRETLLTNREQALISRQLVQLKADVPLTASLDSLPEVVIDRPKLAAFLQENGFRATLRRLEEGAGVWGVGDGKTAPASTPMPPASASDIPFPELGEALPPAVPLAIPHTPHPTPTHYELVTDETALRVWCDAITERGVVAVDTETTSLDPLQAQLVGISLCVTAGHACYIPLAHGAAPAGELDFAAEAKPKQLDKAVVLRQLKPLLEDPAILKIGHNIKYDALVFAGEGVTVAPIDDTIVMSYVCDGARHGHSLDELCDLHFQHKTITYDDVTGTGRKRITFAEVPLDAARDYAAEDVDYTFRLWQLFRQRLLAERQQAVYETLDRPLIPVLTRMEQAGVKVDRVELMRLSADLAQGLAVLETEIHKAAGQVFNIASPKQLGEILFETGKLPGGKKTKTGAYATGSEVLEPLAAQGHILPQKVLEWRQLAKLKSTYTDALQEQINPNTGRVHTSFSQTITSTGRLSSSEPNLQNIPIRTAEGRKIRRAFIAEAGCRLISIDYSQIELRLLAEMADIPVLKQAFAAGRDIHAATASQIFGVPLAEVTPELRRRAKTINFGIIYGISPFGLSQQLGCSQGESKQIIEAYFAEYPGIRAYMDRTVEQCRRFGFVETLFGRRCYVGGINDASAARRNFAERAAINAPIQGTAADIIKRAMIRMDRALRDTGLAARMVLQVHDELIFEARADEVEATIATASAVMRDAALPVVRLSVPLVVEAGAGLSWADAH